MFNKTDSLIFLSQYETIKEAFVRAVYAASEIDLSLEAEDRSHSTLAEVLKQRLETIDTFSPEDMAAAFRLVVPAQRRAADGLGPDEARAALLLPPRVNTVRVANRWLKYVFARLWSEKLVLLPAGFMMKHSFFPAEIRQILPGLPETALCQVSAEASDERSSGLGLRMTFSSNYYKFEDVDIDEFAALTLETIQRDDIRSAMWLGDPRRSRSQLVEVFVRWCEAGQSNGCRYTMAEAKELTYWLKKAVSGTAEYPETAPIDFIRRANLVRQGVKNFHKHSWTLRNRAAQAVVLAGGREETDEKDWIHDVLLSGTLSPVEAKFALLVNDVKSGRAEIYDYFRALRQSGRNKTAELYPSRMGIFPISLWKIWDNAFKKYKIHRQKQGFEGIHGRVTHIELAVRDYICCYLPWWEEVHGIKVLMPQDPSRFTRFGHWIEIDGVNGSSPDSFLKFQQIVRLGNGVEHYNMLVSILELFFDYCRSHAIELNLELNYFENPVVPAMDRLSMRGAPSKTDKIPIKKEIIPWLLRYGYAVEEFYNHVVLRIFAGNASDFDGISLVARRSIMINTAEWGHVPCFEYEGTEYAIQEIPIVGYWKMRKVIDDDRKKRSLFLPSISSFRMCLAALETGLRLQAIQWLCRDTYKSLDKANDPTAQLAPLLVNTDKVKDHPFKTMIIRRAMNLLDREFRFQEMLDEPESKQFVSYENRKETRFAPIKSLFRGPETAAPVTDRSYYSAWERLIVGFQIWFNNNIDRSEPVSMFRIEPVTSRGSDVPVISARSRGGQVLTSCRVRVALEHTPHSARASFISARSGLLPIEVVADLVGHSNKSTTIYYMVEDQEAIERRILNVANLIWDSDQSNPVHIRADQVNSRLVSSFEKDRAATERAFGFRTLGLLAVERPEGDGIALLRSTPMAEIVFRETHICPVGELCPTDVLANIVEPRRCGVCPLAVKSVDHIPAIGAKMRHLLEQIREAGDLISTMKARGEPSASRSEIAERRKIDIVEYEGWKTSQQALLAALRELEEGDPAVMQVGMPEAVERHLKHVSRDVEASQFLLTRLVDSQAYSSVETPLVRAQAAQLRQRLLSSPEALAREVADLPNDPVMSTLSAMRVVLEARGLKASYDAAIGSLSELPQSRNNRLMIDFDGKQES